MSEKKDQNKEVVVETAEQIPQTESEPKKPFILVRAYNWANRKFLQFKATPVGGFVVKGGKVGKNVLAVYGIYKLVDKVRSKSVEREAVITCGEIVDDPETEPMEEEPAEEEINEEHD